MAGKYRLATLGCKVNQYESQLLREVLESLGMTPARPEEIAAVAVVNTCAVTHSASRKNRQLIRRMARHGRTPVIVVGCGATEDAANLHRLDGVVAVLGHKVDVCRTLRDVLIDRVLPPSRTASTPDTGRAREADKRLYPGRKDVWMKPVAAVAGQVLSASRPTSLSNHIIGGPSQPVKNGNNLIARIESFAGHQRAFLKVQDGCDAFCTYCVIPRLRPAVRSKPVDVAVAEARDLVRSGHREIIITGIFLGAYGRDTAIRKRWTARTSPLAQLVGALARVDGLTRLRLSSLEPGDVDEALLDVLASHDACVPHLHLPLQSGSETILRRMNRQYTRDAFLAMIDRVRAALDQPAITTDIIAGFPSETERDFDATVEVARHAAFCKIHAFPFSPRAQTAAARWQEDFVPPPVTQERMQRLADVERASSLAFRRRLVGREERVIVENRRRSDRDGATDRILHGRSDRYFEIHFEADQARPTSPPPTGERRDAPTGDASRPRPGDVARVRIDRVTPTRTIGTLIS